MSDPEVCPICDGPLRESGVRAYDRLVTGEGPFGVRECPACEYGITVPQLRGAELDPYYAQTYYESYYEHAGAKQGVLSRLRGLLRRLGAARRRSRPPYKLDQAPGKVLEVGCGSGELLGELREEGWRTYGIDPSATAVAAAAERGAEVHEGTLADQPWPDDEFQLIIFQHSLEHIPDPPRALRRLGPRVGLEPLEVGTSSNAIATAYSVHYLIAGRWTPGWKLWLAYGLSLPLLPLIWIGDRFGGGDACYAVMTRST